MEWLRERREQLALNQDEIAAQLQVAGFDVSRSSVSHWETGRYRPPLNDPDFLSAFARILRMSEGVILKKSGFKILGSHSEEGERAADIIDELNPAKRELALKILELFQE